MNIVSVSKIIAHNYKNIKLENGIDFGALNILIGPNGSGKSNVIALLQFLQESLAGSGSDDQRGRTNFEDAIYRIGGARILDGTLDAPANVGIEYRFSITEHETMLNIELLVQSAHRQVIIAREFLGRDQGLPEPFFYYNAHNERSGGSGYGVVSVFDDLEGSNSVMKSRTSHFERIQDMPVNELALSAMPRLLESSENPPEATPLYGTRGKIIGSTAAWKFYNANEMNLEQIRLSEPKLGQSDFYVSPSGENLALVLYNLVQEDFEFEDSLNQVFNDILPQTRRVRAVTSGRLSLTVEWYVEDCSEPFFLDEMSDGTVRMLCWAVILNSPKLPLLIVIDEPEVGIHPAWMPILAEWIKRAAQKTQVIVTTHSPDLLDHFTDQLDGGYIYTFQQDQESRNHFRPKRLDKDTVSGWLEDGWQLGDLYRVGNPAVGGWPW